MPSISNGWTREWEERRQKRMAAGGPSAESVAVEAVDAVDQLCMSLQWGEDYTDDYKRRVLTDAIKQVTNDQS